MVPRINLLILGDAISETLIASQIGREKIDEVHVTFPSGVWLVKAMITMYLNGLIAAKQFPSSAPFDTSGEKSFGSSNLSWLATYDYQRFSGTLRNHAYCLGTYKSSPDSEKKVFRVSHSRGWIHHVVMDDSLSSDSSDHDEDRQRLIRTFLRQEIEADFIIVDDRAGDLRKLVRDDPTGRIAKQLIRTLSSARQIVWHLYGPLRDSIWWLVTKGNVSDDLFAKSIIVLGHQALESSGISVPFRTSFETLLDNLHDNEELAVVCKCRNLLIKFPSGTVRMERTAPPSTSSPTSAWSGISICARGLGDLTVGQNGRIAGETSVLVATLFCESLFFDWQTDGPLLGEAEEVWLSTSLNWSTYLSYCYYRDGYTENDTTEAPRSRFAELVAKAERERKRIPRSRKRPLNKEDETVGEVLFHKAVDRGARLTVLKRVSSSKPSSVDGVYNWNRVGSLGKESSKEFEDSLRKIVTLGLDSVAIHSRGTEPSIELPYVTFGKARVIERNELDDYLHLYERFREYITDSSIAQPLCIAVFGPPGAGKNFIVKQLLASIDPSVANASLTFNLSQFRSPDDLWRALHKVQSLALAGDVPLITFDEFDVRDEGSKSGYKWPKYFLGPMEDGKFFDGNDEYLIGRCIFVFAGGTTESYDEFRVAVNSRMTQSTSFDPEPAAPHQTGKPTKHDAERVMDKLVDFHSRLRGHITIGRISAFDGELTPAMRVRRAIILRTNLELDFSHVLKGTAKEARISPQLVNAILNTPAFFHDARSLKAILQMTAGSMQARTLNASMLPPLGQLSMHVEPNDFKERLLASLTKDNKA